ncbi:MAG: 4Fe-4S binding protein, partial [Clostridia bacterium]
ALQATIGSYKYKFPYYVVGFLLFFGAVLGRAVCGFLCPFGLVQDLLYRIPFLKRYKRKSLPGHRALVWMKYVLLIVFVVLLPLVVVDIVGQGAPWFCKYICPSGTLLGGLPMIALQPGLRKSIGFLFTWKVAILAVIVLLSIWVYRPFCKYLCPLGAIYSFFNRVALVRLTVDAD